MLTELLEWPIFGGSGDLGLFGTGETMDGLSGLGRGGLFRLPTKSVGEVYENANRGIAPCSVWRALYGVKSLMGSGLCSYCVWRVVLNCGLARSLLKDYQRFV